MYTAGALELRAFQVFFSRSFAFASYPAVCHIPSHKALLEAGCAIGWEIISSALSYRFLHPMGVEGIFFFLLRGRIDRAVPSSTVCGRLSLFAADSIVEFPVGQSQKSLLANGVVGIKSPHCNVLVPGYNITP